MESSVTKIEGTTRDLGGGFQVRRMLPSAVVRAVGPFVFLDTFGPVTLPAGTGLDVRPHPHINLATVTYLFAGEFLHRDSLGSNQVIQPGDVNWMTAGRGIVHSERSPESARERGVHLHGVQAWVALPKDAEEMDPAFEHHAAKDLPVIEEDGTRHRIIAGSAYGLRAPVTVASPLFYIDVHAKGGGSIALPEEHEERAALIIGGELEVDGECQHAGTMLVFGSGVAPDILARGNSRVLLLGGAPLDGHRHLWWNFVSSRSERIEEAKADWRAGRFAAIPGDDEEFIPLPE